MFYTFLVLGVTHCAAICLYGDDDICAFPCRCTQGCDRTTGACINGGQCELDQVWGERYIGTNCLIGNVALNKRAYHGGNYGGHGADLAVDGDVNPDLSAGHCSYTYTPGGRAWWYLDLGEIHVVARVKLYNVRFQVDAYAVDTLSQLHVRIGNSTSSTSSALVDCFHITNDGILSASSREFTCNSVVYGRYVHIIREYISSSSTRLILCEVVVIGRKVIDCSSCGAGETCTAYGGCGWCPDGKMYPDCRTDCPRGTFGQGCEHNCASASMSHCKEGDTCNPVTGGLVDCPDGCQGGNQYGDWWFYSTCNKELGEMSFGSVDTVDVFPVDVTSTSVTWRWKESTHVPPPAVDVVGYQVYYWYNNIRYLGVDQYHTWTEWQTATVTGLTPGTEYQFNIAVYRQWQEGEKLVGDYWAYSGTVNSPLVASTSVCDRGFYGQICEKICVSHCLGGTDCDPVTGITDTCDGGCEGGVEGQMWWYGDDCAISLGVIQFGSPDVVDTNPASVTATSVTWRWKESTSVPAEAVGDVGYYLYYRLTTSLTWTRGAAVAYRDAQWQEGTVNNLQPGTMYQFDISVYRRWEGGEIQEHANRARDHAIGGKDLSTATLKDSSSSGEPTTPTTTKPTSRVVTTTSYMTSVASSSGFPGTIKPTHRPSQSIETSKLIPSSMSISSVPSTVTFPSVSTTTSRHTDNPTQFTSLSSIRHTSSAPSSDLSAGKSNGLSTGAIIGIALAVTALNIAAVASVLYLYRKGKVCFRNGKSKDGLSTYPPTENTDQGETNKADPQYEIPDRHLIYENTDDNPYEKIEIDQYEVIDFPSVGNGGDHI